MAHRAGIVLGGSVLLLVLGAAAATCGEEEQVFPLQELSLLREGDVSAELASRLPQGQRVKLSGERNPQVKAYPNLRSERPLFGIALLNADPDVPGSGVAFHLAVDASGGPKGRYDRLYVDLDRDLDLSNDAPIGPTSWEPSWAPTRPIDEKIVYFEPLGVPLDVGPPLGVQRLRLLPVLDARDESYAGLTLTATEFRKGEVRIGGRRCDAYLAQGRALAGRFDKPFTGLLLTAPGTPTEGVLGRPADELRAMARVDGVLYRFSASPSGDRLAAGPYRGELGVFHLGAGGRDLKTLRMRGRLVSKTAIVQFGDDAAEAQGSDRASIPVGDYLPQWLDVELGRLRLFVSQTRHSEGRLFDRQGRPAVYGIQIRKDKPFVLDFSGEPEVVFVAPARDARVKRDEQIAVRTMITDPRLDTMIGYLRDASAGGPEKFRYPDGREDARRRRFDPLVTLTNSAGQIVASSVGGFG